MRIFVPFFVIWHFFIPEESFNVKQFTYKHNFFQISEHKGRFFQETDQVLT